jgi:DNA repair protein RadC
MSTLKDIQTIYSQSGVKSLRDSELLLMLGINMEKCDFQTIFNKNKEELIRTGFRPGTALKLVILGEIAQRYASTPTPILQPIKSSSDAAKIIANDLKHLSHEECWVMYLNRANKLIRKERISIGGVSATVVDVKIVLKRALELLACSIILVHNHPSGNNSPGDCDKNQTRVMKDAAALLDITLLDHLIIAGDSYFSFADDGLM